MINSDEVFALPSQLFAAIGSDDDVTANDVSIDDTPHYERDDTIHDVSADGRDANEVVADDVIYNDMGDDEVTIADVAELGKDEL